MREASGEAKEGQCSEEEGTMGEDVSASGAGIPLRPGEHIEERLGEHDARAAGEENGVSRREGSCSTHEGRRKKQRECRESCASRSQRHGVAHRSNHSEAHA